jgi:hypothetical protein
MGYDKNRGLGVNAQGPTKIIEESKQKGRRGLGFAFKEFNDETAEWNFENDPVSACFYSSFSWILDLIFLGSGRRRSSLVSTL